MVRDSVDEIDREILQTLSEDPRMPYSRIASRLEEAGYEMSAEGVRHRVTDLLDESSILLLTAPQGHDWQVLRVDVTVRGGTAAADAVYERLSELDFWLVCRGFGSIDVHAVATAAGVEDATDLLNTVRGLDDVESVDYFLETDRETDVHKYTVE
ncbi:Lrp/AsnC family transcriptional regulator [Halarchaeum nitratireducens]|uniref:HTH asnC-type domain-containing protein n=1 Tax=Halarchaeum nitratireducens TaxID=489913 RepID=A0A830GCS1_9EURY|nr:MULTISPECIES: Lrp/AsnC family transcriptional regulator [Halarchaeum]MBP2252461.1 DNA-binding Lrp family transcriptional regulator [Halarchaeum solikamskense]GGN21039.1 hypothetical protein GCM10009021_22870 [Halarchaeum nitratireducens]